MIGRTIAHYRVLEQLGAGGMGVVYKAEDLRLGRTVALKFLPLDLSRDQAAVQRFEREARTASSLTHPNICTIYAIEEVDGHRFIAMELLDGHPLSNIINGRPVPIGTVLDLGVQIADALEAAHAIGILHRDIKPANIFVTRRGQAKVLDFGLAKLAPLALEHTVASDTNPTVVGSQLTTVGMALGTVSYMSPEQARGEDLDARSDLFSFGIVLYEMVTGNQAFQGRTSAIVFDSILNRMPPPPALTNPDVPPELDRIIAKALEKDRELRYQTASDLRADLQRLRRDRSSGRVAVASGAFAAASDTTAVTAAQGATVAAAATPAPSGPAPADAVLAPAAPGAVGPAGAPAPQAATAAKPRATKASRVPLAVGALVILATVAGVAYWQLRPRPPVEATSAAVAEPPPPPVETAPEVPPVDAPPADSTSGEASADAALSTAEPTAAPAATAPVPAATPGAKPPQSRPRATKQPPAAAKAAEPPPLQAVVPVVPRASPTTRPDPGVTLLDVARAKVDSRLLDQALTDVRTILRDHPSSPAAPPALLLAGRVHELAGRPDDVMAAYVELRSRYGSSAASAEGTVLLAQLLLKSKRSDRVSQARTLLGEVPDAHGDSPWAPHALAAKALIETREKIKERDATLNAVVPAALVTNRRLVERYPDAKQAEVAFWQLGEAYDDLKRYDLAAEAYAALGTRFPQTRYDAWWRAGEIQEKRLRNQAEARAAYEKVPQRSPNYREARKRVGTQ